LQDRLGCRFGTQDSSGIHNEEIPRRIWTSMIRCRC
jgi:hypothetical protein